MRMHLGSDLYGKASVTNEASSINAIDSKKAIKDSIHWYLTVFSLFLAISDKLLAYISLMR